MEGKYEMKLAEPYKYKEEQIQSFINTLDISKVNRIGVYNTLAEIEKAVTYVFHDADYMTYDMGYFVSDINELKNMNKIEDMIVQRLLEIYAICMVGMDKIQKNN